MDGESDSDVPLGVPVALEGVSVSYFPSTTLRRLYFSGSLTSALWRRVREFDLLHLHSVFLWPTTFAAHVARRFNVPYVVSPRGMLVESLVQQRSRLPKMAWIALFERRNLENAALVHVTSRIEEEEIRNFPMAWPPIEVIPNGVGAHSAVGGDTGLSPMSPDAEPTLLMIGRVTWKKGIDRMIEALQFLPGVKLVVAGNDDEQYIPALQNLAAVRGVQERVAFVGPAYGPTKQALLQRCTMLVLPSQSENFGNVVLEAMAAGRAVLVTPEVGSADLVRQADAGVVCAGDPLTIAGAIRSLLGDPVRLAAMARNGASFAGTQMAWEAVAERMEGVYRIQAGLDSAIGTARRRGNEH